MFRTIAFTIMILGFAATASAVLLVLIIVALRSVDVQDWHKVVADPVVVSLGLLGAAWTADLWFRSALFTRMAGTVAVLAAVATLLLVRRRILDRLKTRSALPWLYASFAVLTIGFCIAATGMLTPDLDTRHCQGRPSECVWLRERNQSGTQPSGASCNALPARVRHVEQHGDDTRFDVHRSVPANPRGPPRAAPWR